MINLVQRALAHVGQLLRLLGKGRLVLCGGGAALGAIPGADAGVAGDRGGEAGGVVGLRKIYGR